MEDIKPASLKKSEFQKKSTTNATLLLFSATSANRSRKKQFKECSAEPNCCFFSTF